MNKTQPQRPNANTCSRSYVSTNVEGTPFPALVPAALMRTQALDACEAKIVAAQRSAFEIGRQLRKIKEERLYKERYDTFEAYVEERWDFTVRRAQQYVAAAECVDALEGAGLTELPTNEAQCRAMAPLSTEKKVAVWAYCIKHAAGKPISKADVKAAVGVVVRGKGRDAKPGPAATWEPQAKRALKAVAEEHRAAFERVVNEMAAREDFDIDEHTVAEAAEGYNACVVESSGGELPVVVGKVFSAAEEDAVDEPMLPEVELPVLNGDLAHGVAQKRSGFFIGSVARRPLLVALPTFAAPPQLTDGLADTVKEVIVEIGELEKFGGPVKGGVLDVDAVREACRENGLVQHFTRTNEHVDWARFTANPLTGCRHSCREVFCYASGIAQRLFPQGFTPTLYPARLNAFTDTRPPSIEGLGDDAAWRERSVFCVSMGDLFGAWVPAWYVEAVLAEVALHPEWFVFFLTKHPKRLGEFTFPANCAVGLTITGDEPYGRETTPEQQAERYARYAEELGGAKGAAFTWLSLEPFRGPVHDLNPFFDAGVRLLAMGGQSRTRFCGPMQPKARWVERARAQAYAAAVHVFEKENLTVRPKNIPFPQGPPPARRTG